MIEKLEEELNNCHERETKTTIRGRLIQAIKEEIKKEENSEKKEKLEVHLKEVLKEQRKDLDERYINEFVKEKAILGSAITTLPKGVGLAVKKVSNTIEELKEAKTNKEKIFRTIDLIASLGKTAITPVLYAGKFAIRHWYAFLIAIGILDVTDTNLFKKGMDLLNKNTENSKILEVLEKVKENILVSKTRDVTHLVVGKIGEEINKRFGNVLDKLKQTISDKLNPFDDLISSFRDNPNILEDFIRENSDSVQEMSSFLKQNPISDNSESYELAKALCSTYDNMLLGMQKTL